MSSPDEIAASKVREAEVALEEAMRFLNYYRTETLSLAMLYLREVAKALESGEKRKALELPLIDRRAAGQIMGRSKSSAKIEAIAKARAVLAIKREQAALIKRRHTRSS